MTTEFNRKLATFTRVDWKSRVVKERVVLSDLKHQSKMVYLYNALKLLNRRVPNGTHGGVRGRLLN